MDTYCTLQVIIWYYFTHCIAKMFTNLAIENSLHWFLCPIYIFLLLWLFKFLSTLKKKKKNFFLNYKTIQTHFIYFLLQS